MLHATILASMEELETKKLMTHDRAFKRLDFIEVVDPICSWIKRT